MNQQDQNTHRLWTSLSLWTSFHRMFTSAAEIQKTTRQQHRRERDGLEEDLDEAHDEQVRLIRKTNELQVRCADLTRSHAALDRENAVTREVLRHMANRSEAFRMTLAHLHQAWSPQQPDSDPLKHHEAITELVETHCRELVDDAEWKAHRDGRFADYLRSRMQEETAPHVDPTADEAAFPGKAR